MPAWVVPFNDPGASYRRQRAEIDAAVGRVLASGWYVGGPEVESFERAFAATAGAAHTVGVANGTDAIALALRALGVRAGDHVIVPAVSAYPTATAVVQIGAAPVFVDVDARDGTIDPARAEAAFTKDVRALVAVHLYGNVADARRLAELCQHRGVPFVEDCAQAHLAALDGKPAGTFGQAAAWSFYPTKNLGAFGDAGAVTCADDATAARLRELRNYGQRTRYEHVTPGINSRLDPLQAAILIAKLPHLAQDTERRRGIAAAYDRAFAKAKRLTALVPRAGSAPSRHLYPVLLAAEDARPAFQAALASQGVETLVHYPIPMPDQEATHAVAHVSHDVSVARSFCKRVVSLPLYPSLTDEQVEGVIAAVDQWDRAA